MAVALAEWCIWAGKGIATDIPNNDAATAGTLFGESPSRIVLTITPERIDAVVALANDRHVEIRSIGVVRGDRLLVYGLDVAVSDLSDAWSNGLGRALRGE